MTRQRKLVKFATSEGSVIFATSIKMAEKFFRVKPDSFIAIFAGEEIMVENDYGYFIQGNPLVHLERGIYTYDSNSF